MSYQNGTHPASDNSEDEAPQFGALTLGTLAGRRRWVAWQTEERDKGKPPTKVPYAPGYGGGRAKADNHATWGTRAEAKTREAKLPKPFGIGGVGIELGDLGDGTSIGGVDLDSCRNPDGALEPWASEVLDLLGTYAETSPSGAGVKAFFRYKTGDLPDLRQAMGTETGRKWTRGNGKEHAPAIELYLCGRFFAVTDDHHEGTPLGLAIVNHSVLLKIIRDIGPGFAAGATAANCSYGHAAALDRSAAAMGIGAKMRRAGKSFEEMCAAIEADPATKDWYREKGVVNNKRELHRIWDKPEQSAGDETDDAAIERLARLPPIRYDRVRQDEAERLGCLASTLDKLVRNARGDGADRGAGQGRPLDLPAPEPWPEPVDGAALLDALAAHFTRHLHLPAGAADAMALWSVHAHCFALFSFTPRLQFKATDPGSGKSTALMLVKGVVPKPLETETATSAALFRVIDLLAPTVLLDEADTYLRDDEEMRGLVNAGVAPGGQALRCVGENQEPRAFNCHAPLCLAGLGSLAPTIEDRAIRITMVRRLPSEKIEPVEEADRTRADELLRQAARWTADNTEALRDARPDMGTLYNRAADRWRALYAIADLAGDRWKERVRAATVALTPADDDAVSLGLQLLGDIRNVLADGQAAPDWIRSGELVHRLVGLQGHPWAELGRARKPLTTNRLARMLRPYGIVPGLHGDDRISGYTVNSFNDAFARNLS